MGWKTIGEARFRSYREYRTMHENLTAAQARGTELLLEVRELKRQLRDRDAFIGRLQVLLSLSGAPTIPPPSSTKLPLPPPVPALPEDHDDYDDELPLPK
jgi:hypothetical protein